MNPIKPQEKPVPAPAPEMLKAALAWQEEQARRKARRVAEVQETRKELEREGHKNISLAFINQRIWDKKQARRKAWLLRQGKATVEEIIKQHAEEKS